MDPVLQDALCDKNWVHNPADWGIARFRTDGTGSLDLSMEMRTHLSADFVWRPTAPATADDGGPVRGDQGPGTAAAATNPRTKTTVASTRRFEVELTLRKTGPPGPDDPNRGLTERAFRPRTLAVRLSEGRFPRQHPFLGTVQVYGRRLQFEPAVFPELQDWTEEYAKMAAAGRFHEWKSFFSEPLEEFEVEAPLEDEEE